LSEATVELGLSKETLAKIEVVRKWVSENGLIWSRKVLYELVSAGLVKDTANTRYQAVCQLFKKLRKAGVVPYEWFKDKKTSLRNTGVGDASTFDESFQRLCKYYSRSAKSMQKNYVEIWTEKELPERVVNLTYEYDVGLLTSEGFVGDVAQHQAVERLKEIKAEFNIQPYVIYISDYDSEGEHIFNLNKRELEAVGVEVSKLAVTKEDVKALSLISNIGYRERMLKPRTLKYHLSKQYVQDFLQRNRDLAPDGIVQYETEAYPVSTLHDRLQSQLSSLIDKDKIEKLDELCRREVKRWLKKHYKGKVKAE